MNRIFIRQFADIAKEEQQYKLNIGVTGLSQSAGATFIASTLAFYFSHMGKSVTFCQCLDTSFPRRILFDEVAMEQRFGYREFQRLYEKVKGEVYVGDNDNLERSIRWILPTPEDIEERITLTEKEKSRLIRCCKSEVCIFDFDALGGFDEYMQDMDLLIAVADSLPSALISGRQRYRVLRHLKESGLNVKWAVNKWNQEANKRQIKGYLHDEINMWIPDFSSAEIYKDEYACRFHWDNPKIKETLMEIFTKISHEQAE